MLNKRIYPDKSDENVWLDVYVSQDTMSPPPSRAAVLILPGGGYSSCSHREAEPIALAFLSRGINAFVLYYRTGSENYLYPRQLTDASWAMVHIRENAEEYGIDPTRVAVLGFSAGGHLAGSLALMHSERQILDSLGIKEGDNRPDAVVLCYPVVSAERPTHENSFKNLLGKPFDSLTEDERNRFSLEKRVDKSSPPAFIWHTAEDTAVSPIGSLKLAESYIAAGAPVTLRLYPKGPHGISLANRITMSNSSHVQPTAQKWVDEAVEFLDLCFKSE
ncbi:MAG: alpha/beta hydrolase [Clostridia bacterium]|nr:alpha/beta hydrolase [Clostridia bacterium]